MLKTPLTACAALKRRKRAKARLPRGEPSLLFVSRRIFLEVILTRRWLPESTARRLPSGVSTYLATTVRTHKTTSSLLRALRFDRLAKSDPVAADCPSCYVCTIQYTYP